MLWKDRFVVQLWQFEYCNLASTAPLKARQNSADERLFSMQGAPQLQKTTALPHLPAKNAAALLCLAHPSSNLTNISTSMWQCLQHHSLLEFSSNFLNRRGRLAGVSNTTGITDSSRHRYSWTSCSHWLTGENKCFSYTAAGWEQITL